MQATTALLTIDDFERQRFVPDLAVEIASNSDTYEGLHTAGAIRALRGTDAFETHLLPDFSITVERLFQNL